MARNHGRILTSIWADKDFRRLSPEGQRLYLFLVSQPNLNHAGLLPLTLRRWSGAAAGLTVDDVQRALAELIGARFVVVDEDTEELLIRTLVRNDGVWKQPKVMLAMEGSAQEIVSPMLQAALAAELDRLDLVSLSDEPSKSGDSTRGVVQGVIRRLKAAFPTVTPRVSGRVSDTPAEAFPPDTAPSRRENADSATSDSPAGDKTAGPWVLDTLPDTPDEPLAVPNAEGTGNPHARARTHSPSPSPSPAPSPPPPPAAPLAAPAPEIPGAPEDPGEETRGEGEEDFPTKDGEHRLPELVAEVRAIRPEWSRASITKAITVPSVAERPWDAVRAAIIAVAQDPKSQAPGRVKHDGPWWHQPRRTHASSSANSRPVTEVIGGTLPPLGERENPANARGAAIARAAISKPQEPTS